MYTVHIDSKIIDKTSFIRCFIRRWTEYLVVDFPRIVYLPQVLMFFMFRWLSSQEG